MIPSLAVFSWSLLEEKSSLSATVEKHVLYLLVIIDALEHLVIE